MPRGIRNPISWLYRGQANGVGSLGADGKQPLSELNAAVQTGLRYQGTWNAATNTPALASGVGTQGYYYIVSVAGATNLDGVTDWKAGDWAVFGSATWTKIDNTENEILARRPVNDVADTLLAADSGGIVAYTAISVSRAVTLPNPATVGAGWHCTIKDESGSASTAVKLTYVGTIDGLVNGDLIREPYGGIEIYSNGAAFFARRRVRFTSTAFAVSSTFTAPFTGWYLVRGRGGSGGGAGGGGGGGGSTAAGARGGGAGRSGGSCVTLDKWVYLTAGQVYTVTIGAAGNGGAGGAGATANGAGASGVNGTDGTRGGSTSLDALAVFPGGGKGRAGSFGGIATTGVVSVSADTGTCGILPGSAGNGGVAATAGTVAENGVRFNEADNGANGAVGASGGANGGGGGGPGGGAGGADAGFTPPSGANGGAGGAAGADGGVGQDGTVSPGGGIGGTGGAGGGGGGLLAVTGTNGGKGGDGKAGTAGAMTIIYLGR